MKTLFALFIIPILAFAPAPLLAQDAAASEGLQDDYSPAEPQTPITLNGRNQLISMEDLRNPLVIFQTLRGDFVVELLPAAAPRTVANFLALAEGSRAFIDPRSGTEVLQPFYDGLVIHRIERDFIIQAGSPDGSPDGGPGFSIADEINAGSLGLDRMPLIDPEGYPNAQLRIRDQEDFRQRILLPLYRSMGINSPELLAARTGDVDARLRSMSVKDLYELEGYRYVQNLQSRSLQRGMLAMAGGGANGNGSQFFLTLADTPWLDGRHTVFGRIRAGMEVVDAIGRIPVDANKRPLESFSILLVRQLIVP